MRGQTKTYLPFERLPPRGLAASYRRRGISKLYGALTEQFLPDGRNGDFYNVRICRLYRHGAKQA